ncbi:MAG: metallophosphoesterase family protein [Jaaginema sp. PMC 1079.18]|nr:metallophosphoesterase family protein [Jaaginema sp. PMC 1080.18]MEC4850560.1 metallophosphoesterase family protein [Jaaginema sp. PMC 1079.18]MEC4865468.1 metallophosphoesterase family protein [Jaaginema sp. PMC 1078.18]
MNVFVVGDVHGCLKTFQTLLDRHWQPETEVLVQLGDLINRGNFIAETILYIQELQEKWCDRAIVLRGNHEQKFINFVASGCDRDWPLKSRKKTIASLQRHHLELAEVSEWLQQLPLVWETEALCLTHAGIATATDKAFDPNNQNGVLWTRSPLKNIGKLQVVGHTPMPGGCPRYNPDSHVWYIDTGVFLKRKLTGIKFNEQGQILEKHSIRTDPLDI